MLQRFQKLKVEQGFNHLAAMDERVVAPIFSKKPQQSSKKDYSQAWETQHFYYHLVAKTATISLLNFRGTSSLGFDAFCGTFLKPRKQNSCQSGDYRIKHGNCRMTRSYRKVEPISLECKCDQEVMTNQSKFQQTFMIWGKYKCVSTIGTAIAKDLISQPKLGEVLTMAAMAMSIHFLLVLWRETAPEVPPVWFVGLDAIIQFLPIFINYLLRPNTTTIGYTIAASVLGLVLGSMARNSFYPHKTFSHR